MFLKQDITMIDPVIAKIQSHPKYAQLRKQRNATVLMAEVTGIDKAQRQVLLGDGQKLLTQLDLAPLPASIDSAAVAQLDKITSAS